MPREVPHDLEAERALLGSMLISQEKCVNVLDKTTEDDFYEVPHRIIITAMAALKKQGMPVDVTTLTSYLVDHEQLDSMGGVDYLLQLSESVPTIEHTDYYLTILQNKSMLRNIIKEASEIAEGAYDHVENVQMFMAEAENRIMAATKDRTSGGFKDIASVVTEVTTELNELAKSDKKVNGITTGFRDLDKLTLGFQPGSLNIIAARPAMGKTAFALNIAQNVAHNADKPVVLFSLEMDAGALVKRIIGASGRIRGDDIKTGDVIKKQAPTYYAAAQKAAACNMVIDDSGGITINDISAKCRQLSSKTGGLSLILIDYLQLINGPSGGRESRQQEISDISRQLKSLARSLEVPVIALSQLSRAVEQRPNKRPMLSDLRESGAIEQDADLVSFIYREGYYKDPAEQSEDQGLTEVIIAKHRNGPTGDVQLVFEKDYSKFSDLAKIGPGGAGPDTRNLRS
ncbi:MAG: replicative DNA helicase [Coprobacillaceae bacterium]